MTRKPPTRSGASRETVFAQDEVTRIVSRVALLVAFTIGLALPLGYASSTIEARW
ncbi:MAG TPA: hypothetical protein PLA97_12165 [Rubrivivax sp.]|nr:hypothetical protein [Rubrivivax sp.]